MKKIEWVVVVIVCAVLVLAGAVLLKYKGPQPGGWEKSEVVDFGDSYMVVYKHEGTGECKHQWFEKGEK